MVLFFLLNFRTILEYTKLVALWCFFTKFQDYFGVHQTSGIMVLFYLNFRTILEYTKLVALWCFLFKFQDYFGVHRIDGIVYVKNQLDRETAETVILHIFVRDLLGDDFTRQTATGNSVTESRARNYNAS